MKILKSKLFKWIVRMIGLLVVIVVIDATILAYPYFKFPYEYQKGSLTFYSDLEINPELKIIADKVAEQAAVWEIYDPDHVSDIFLCQKQETYNFFARLTLVQTIIPGYNLSIFENSFLSLERIAEISRTNGGQPKYSVMEGELSHCIAHELLHDYQVEKNGYFKNQDLPRWKREGYAEYQASLNRFRVDSIYTLEDRIDLIENNYYWTDHVIEYYSWRTVTEYLFEIEKYNFDEYLADEITFEDAYKNMLTWYDSNY